MLKINNVIENVEHVTSGGQRKKNLFLFTEFKIWYRSKGNKLRVLSLESPQQNPSLLFNFRPALHISVNSVQDD